MAQIVIQYANGTKGKPATLGTSHRDARRILELAKLTGELAVIPIVEDGKEYTAYLNLQHVVTVVIADEGFE